MALGLCLLLPGGAAADYACNFVEVQCDRASKAVRVVPFSAVNEDCDRVRALKNASWLVDVARRIRSTAKDRIGPGSPQGVKCELGEKKLVWVFVQAWPVNSNLQGRCGTVFSAKVTIEEQEPRYRRVVNDLNLLPNCHAGGAVDLIEYFIDAQKVLMQWSSESNFGPLERAAQTRRHLHEAKKTR